MTWRSYTLDMSDAQVREAFVLRFGYEPQRVWRDGTVIMAGPIRVEDMLNAYKKSH